MADGMADEHATSSRASIPNPALRPLSTLVGEWELEASVGGQPLGRGRTVFEWLEGGAFLVQRSDVAQAEFPAATVIIGRDDATETYCMLHFDSRGVSRVYQMSLNDAGVWQMWREAPGFSQRFMGTISDDGRTIRGHWEKSGDGSTWEHDFDLMYTKVG